jgi:hypothetical protein
LNDPVRRMWPCIRWLLESHMGRQRRKTKRRRTPRRVRASMSWCGWFRCRHRGRCPQMWLLVVRTSERRNLDGRALLIAVWRHSRSVINYLRTRGILCNFGNSQWQFQGITESNNFISYWPVDRAKDDVK